MPSKKLKKKIATKSAKKVAAKRVAAKPTLLAGDNPQIPKGEGDAPVQAYLAAIPGWKQDVARRVDALIVRVVPGVRKAIKWNSPFYGIEGQGEASPAPTPGPPPPTPRGAPRQGWFLSTHCFTKYVKLTFFKGTSLRPPPPGASKHPEVRYLDIHEGELDEARLASWVKQASELPGWSGS